VLKFKEKQANKARARMYKTKIRAWGIGKRLRDEDILAILHIQQQRRAEMLDPSELDLEFWVRGYRVSDDNIRRYLRRKPKLLTQFRSGRLPGAQDLAGVACTARSPAPQVSPSRRSRGGPLYDAEELLASCKGYIAGSLAVGRWVQGADGSVLSRSAAHLGKDSQLELGNHVQSTFYAAVDALGRSDFSEAFRVLDLSFRSTRRALQLEIPRLVPLALNVTRLLDRRAQHDVLAVFLRYLRLQIRTLPPPPPAAGSAQATGHRQLARVLDTLARLSPPAYGDVFERVFALLIDEADAALGPDSCLSFDIFWDLFGTLGVLQEAPRQVEWLTRQLAKLPIRDTDDAAAAGAGIGIGASDPREKPWVLRTERLLAWKVAQWKAAAGEFAEAKRALRTAEETLQLAGGADERPRHYMFSGKIFISMGDLAAAERCFSMAVRECDDPDSVQYSLEQLARVLDLRARPAEAAEVRAYARRRLGDVAAQVDWDWDEFARRTAEQPLPGGDEEDDEEG